MNTVVYIIHIFIAPPPGSNVMNILATRVPGTCPISDGLQIQCGNGSCVPFSKYHDCILDCNDGIDECNYKNRV